MFKPLYDQVLIEKIEFAETTKSGIIISTASSVKNNCEGKVVAIGKGYRTTDGKILKLTVKPGDVVLYRKGVEVLIEDDDGKEYFAVSETNILGVK